MKKLLLAFLLSLAPLLASAQPMPVRIVPNGGMPVSVVGPLQNLSISPARKLCVFGDSITFNADQVSGNNTVAGLNGGYATWLNIYTGYRVYRAAGTNNFGVSGNTTAQMLARISDVLSANCGVVVIEGGTNDAVTSVPCATIVSNLQAMYASFANSNVAVIRSTIFPRPGTGGATSFTAAQAQNAMCANNADRQYVAANHPGFYLNDLDPVMTDASQATWTIKTNYLNADGVHESQLGGKADGQALAAIINQLAVPQFQPDLTPGNSYDATNNPTGNMLQNGLFTGTSGTANNGCTTSSGVAANWLVSGSSAGGATCAATLGSAAGGNAKQIITLSGTYTGNGRNVLIQGLVPTVTRDALVAGQKIQGEAWVTFGANTNVVAVDVWLVTTEGGVTRIFQAAHPDTTTPGGLPAGYGSTIVPIKTQVRTLTATPTGNIELDILVYLQDSAGSSSSVGVAELSSASIHLVSN